MTQFPEPPGSALKAILEGQGVELPEAEGNSSAARSKRLEPYIALVERNKDHPYNEMIEFQLPEDDFFVMGQSPSAGDERDPYFGRRLRKMMGELR